MKETFSPLRDSLSDQENDTPPVDVLAGEEQQQVDTDDERDITQAKKERCPECDSDQIGKFTTRADHTVLRCPMCRNYFCLNCKGKLLDRRMLDRRNGPIPCPKCQKPL